MHLNNKSTELLNVSNQRISAALFYWEAKVFSGDSATGPAVWQPHHSSREGWHMAMEPHETAACGCNTFHRLSRGCSFNETPTLHCQSVKSTKKFLWFFFLVSAGVWHFPKRRPSATWRHAAGHTQLLWAWKCQQRSGGAVPRRGGSHVQSPAEGRSICDQLQPGPGPRRLGSAGTIPPEWA